MSGTSGSPQQPVVTQTQTRDPWAGAQPYLQQMMGTASGMQAGGVGYQPYGGPTQAPLNSAVQDAGTAMWGLANAQIANDPTAPALGQARSVVESQGITPGIQSALGGLGQLPDYYKGVGGNLIEPWNLYRTMGAQAQGNENPYLEQTLQNTVGRQINSSMSGAGRYGSGAHQEAIAAGFAPALMQDYEARQQRLGQAAQGISGLVGQQAQLGQLQGGVYGGMADIYSRGLGQAGQFAQQIPGLMQAQYMPYQQQMGWGQYNQDRQQADLNAQIKLYNAQQAYPWEQLARESAIVGGAGGLGGTSVTAQTPQQAPALNRLLGGALVGGGLGSAFGPVGSGVGALGGAGLGYLL